MARGPGFRALWPRDVCHTGREQADRNEPLLAATSLLLATNH